MNTLLTLLTIVTHCTFRIINPAFNTITYTAHQAGDICITTSAGAALLYTSDIQQDTTVLPRTTTNCFYLQQNETATITLQRKGANKVCINFLPTTPTSLNTNRLNQSKLTINHSHIILTPSLEQIELQHTQSPDRPVWSTIYTIKHKNNTVGTTIKIYDNLPHTERQGTGWHYYRLKHTDKTTLQSTYSDVYSYNDEVDNSNNTNSNTKEHKINYGKTTIYITEDTRTNRVTKQIRRH